MKTTIAALLDELHELPIIAAVRAGDVAAYKAMTGNGYTAFCSLENLIFKPHGCYVRVTRRDYDILTNGRK